MRVVHEADGGAERTLASEVEVAEGILSKGIGLMFRRSIPAEYAMVFPFSSVKRRSMHMMCVPFDIDVLWLEGDEVQQVERLSAWTGLESGRANTVVELPAGAADDVEAGDRVWVEGH